MQQIPVMAVMVFTKSDTISLFYGPEKVKINGLGANELPLAVICY